MPYNQNAIQMPEIFEDMLGDRMVQYREAPWLLSDFDEPVWICSWNNKKNTIINFSISLIDQSLLTDAKNSRLLETFKCWLCVQTHLDATGGLVLGPATVKAKIRQALHVIDYILLNGEQLEIASFGLEAITPNDIEALFYKRSLSKNVSESIYRWPEQLRCFLLEGISSVPISLLQNRIKEIPFLCENIAISGDPTFGGLSNEEIIYARAWLWENDYYYTTSQLEYKYTVNTKRISKIIYKDTLAGISTTKYVPEELMLLAVAPFIREYAAVPTQTNLEERASEPQLAQLKSTLETLGLLADANLPIPATVLDKISSIDTFSYGAKTIGRFKTLHVEVVFPALKNSIEFALRYGDDILSSCIEVIKDAQSNGRSCHDYNEKFDIRPLVSESLRDLGVTRWSIFDVLSRRGDRRGERRKKYFVHLRANIGLWQLMRILYGAIQLCIGVVMARRQQELIALTAGTCLSNDERHLIFFNEKSGTLGKREKEQRPAPPIVALLIKKLEQFQNSLLDYGIINSKTNIFSYLSSTGNQLSHNYATSFDRSLDFFCDYFETALDVEGRRYYIRQHQLRRFFAMLFFWGSSYGGLDTLRWFLGHTDARHLYHYITESIPGAVLREVKALYTTEKIQAHAQEVEKIETLLMQRFGARCFSILDTEELGQYINVLLEDGTLKVEPEFFDSEDGKSYRILFLVTSEDNVP